MNPNKPLRQLSDEEQWEAALAHQQEVDADICRRVSKRFHQAMNQLDLEHRARLLQIKKDERMMICVVVGIFVGAVVIPLLCSLLFR
jgi:hypothetical protein